MDRFGSSWSLSNWIEFNAKIYNGKHWKYLHHEIVTFDKSLELNTDICMTITGFKDPQNAKE